MKAIWRRHDRGLYPASDEATEMLHSLDSGQECLGTFHVPRNLRQHRLYWALMGVLVDHQVFPTAEAASNATKIATGHFDCVLLPDSGEVHLVPKSIAFAAMKQPHFSEFLQAAIQKICDRWLTGTDNDELLKHVFQLVYGPEAQVYVGKRT